MAEGDTPQWKKHLIARLREQNKCNNGNSAVTVSNKKQLAPLSTSSSTGRKPNQTSGVSVGIRTCNQLSDKSAVSYQKNIIKNDRNLIKPKKSLNMVQERAWTDYTSCESVEMVSENDYSKSDSDSSEELHYGPGIVNKLKNKYLSLTLRRDNYAKQRPSILNLRKATSLENLLDDDDDDEDEEEVKNNELEQRCYKSNGNSTNRYRSQKRSTENIKRARSVETISRFENMISPPPKVEKERPKSLHEYILIDDKKEGNDKLYRKPKDKTENEIFSNNYTPCINRPKRITPVMNEREKPPTDVVKQAKMIFEKRPEQRTKPPVNTGEVAAKVATYKNIIVQSKKPSVKLKPATVTEKPKNSSNKTKIEPKLKKTNSSEVVDAPKVTPRIRGVSKKNSPPKELKLIETPVENKKVSPIPDVSIVEFVKTENDVNRLCETPDLLLTTGPIAISTPSMNDCKNGTLSPTSLLNKTEEIIEKIPLNEPLKLIINGNQQQQNQSTPHSRIISPPIRKQSKDIPIDRVIEKNLINTVKNLEGTKIHSASDKNDVLVPKKINKKPPIEPETNSIVFKFTDRKDVPDYVQNDKTRTANRLEKPKVGEGGIIILPGASFNDSFNDEDEEIKKYLQAPPSPCDVTFINDNILIDGKSSINQKTKKCRMKISFVDCVPDVYEYPSESSLLIEEVSSPTTPLAGHTVPNLSGSTLANYTPKSTEDFQPGVSRSKPNVPPPPPPQNKDLPDDVEEVILEEVKQPITFSAGTNSDMLF